LSNKSWEEILGVENVHVITDMNALYSSFNEIVRIIFELPRIETNIVTKEESFDLPPYLDKIEFHIFPEKEIKLNIVAPDGSIPEGKRTEGSGYSIVTIDKPLPGTWKFKTVGSGEVKVIRNPIPFKMHLIDPEIIHPIGKPIFLKAVFERKDGKEIEDHPDYPLSFTAKIIFPDKRDENIQFLAKDKVGSVWYADKEVKADSAGEYKIILTVKGGTQFNTTSTWKITARSFPYIAMKIPSNFKTYPLENKMDIALQLVRDGKITNPEKEFEDHPNNLIKAQFVNLLGNGVGKGIWLSYDQSGKFFSGTIPYEMKEGSYRLAMELIGTPRFQVEGLPAKTMELVNFYIKPTFWQEIISFLLKGLCFIVILLLLWTLAVTVWLMKGKKITATLTLQRLDGTSESIYLANKKWLKPTWVKGYEHDAQRHSSIKLWGKTIDSDAIRLYKGGWASILSLGLLASPLTLKREESTTLGGFNLILD
jgi:hypothetical protein